MIDFEIMEYNFETKKYTTIGLAEAADAKQAKEKFIKETGWTGSENIFLFAKYPLCR